MLTEDEAVDAAFIAGAHLVAVMTKGNDDGINWMGAREGVDVDDLKRRAGAFVRHHKGALNQHDDVEMVTAMLIVCLQGLVTSITPLHHNAFYTFVSVLIAFERLSEIERRYAETARIATAPTPHASAWDIPDDERIDAPAPDLYERVDLGTSFAPAPAKASKKGGK